MKCALASVIFLSVLAVPAFATGVTYTYDDLGRIATATYDNGTSVMKITYSYDPAGNRTSVVTATP